MRGTCVGLVAAMVCGLVASALAADDAAARALVKSMFDGKPPTTFSARAKLLAPGGWTRELVVFHKRIASGETATFMEVTTPQDVRDTRFLFLERAEGGNRQFMYLPTVRRAIEVVDASRAEGFLGSDFAVADLVAPDVDAYTYAFVGEEQVQGRSCRLVELTPKDAAVEVYGRLIAAIDPADKLLVRTQFFDKKNAPYKVWTLTHVEKINGIWTPRRQEMENVRKQTKSTLELDEIKYDVELADKLFGREHLTR